jgi:hypothetical protein
MNSFKHPVNNAISSTISLSCMGVSDGSDVPFMHPVINSTIPLIYFEKYDSEKIQNKLSFHLRLKMNKASFL